MKQGSTDDPFAEDPESDTNPEATTADTETATEGEPDARTTSTADSSTNSPQRLPYKYSRESVKEGREQRPIFLRPEIETGIDDLVDDLEARLGEDVYKTDVMEAAVAVAQARPDLIADELREWGYDWE